MDFHKSEADKQIRMILEVKNQYIIILSSLCKELLYKYYISQLSLIQTYNNTEEELKKIDDEYKILQNKIKQFTGE